MRWFDGQSTAVHDETRRISNMKKTYVISSIIAVALVLAICSQITFFVVPPIGAVPEGRDLTDFFVPLVSRDSRPQWLNYVR
ncbi:hypothetical protein PAP18089_02646 [Pandoraea apista]|uniref:Uncharacterized protein n=1 Tax=Pandoraea apista TaxID=93218 RepID=A0A5E5P505_9BURK|nr:hypothetical protein PAP18089_02646 [Pandoraea apista]